jgi:predicted small secreted protein
MKYVWIIVAVLALNGCNTLIGMGRDTKEGFTWTNNKVQQWRTGGQSNEVAPVY